MLVPEYGHSSRAVHAAWRPDGRDTQHVATNIPAPARRPSAKDLVVPTVVFVSATMLIAVPYWTAGYDSIKDDGIFGSWRLVAMVLVLGTFLAASVGELSPFVVAPCFLLCAPVAVIGRVLLDVTADPTSHDLWPLEIAVSLMLSVPAVGIGAVLAWVVRLLSPRHG